MFQSFDHHQGAVKTCWSIFKSFNVNSSSVCIGWCADQVTAKCTVQR
jgi:hypothetical protein